MGKESKHCKVICDRLLYLLIDNLYKSKWFMTISSTLEEYMPVVWENQTSGHINVPKYPIAKNLKCPCIVKWNKRLNNMTICDVYLGLYLRLSMLI